MAKRVTPAPAAPKSDARAAKAMTKKRFTDLMAALKSSQNVMDDERSSQGGLVKAAVENHNYHKGAGGWAKKLHKMDRAKALEQLFHFHIYCEYLGLSGGDMLDDRKPASDAGDDEGAADNGEPHDNPDVKATEVIASDRHPGVRGDQLAGFPEAETSDAATDAGNVHDLRPRYLQTGSAAAPVKPEPKTKH